MKTILGARIGWVVTLLMGVGSAGCDAAESSEQFDQPLPSQQPDEQPVEQPEEQPEEQVDAELFDVANVTPLDALPASDTPVGVAIDPTGTKRFVLTEESGLYEMGEGSATLVFDTNRLPVTDFLPELPFTDVVALSNKRFALTAKNEGYLLDTQDGSLTRFFCYLPSDYPGDTPVTEQSISETLTEQGVAVYQITLAVTHNAALGLLFAHPITVGTNDGHVYGAEVGAFSDLTGEPMQWSLVPSGKLATAGATGMIVDDSGMVTLARGFDLYSYDGVSVPSRIDSLDRYGVGEIEGLAAVPGSNHVLVLDAQRRQLVELAPRT